MALELFEVFDMLDLIQIVSSTSNDIALKQVEKKLLESDFKVITVDAGGQNDILDSGAKMIEQIVENSINPTQVQIILADSLDRLMRSDALAASLGRDMSDPAAYGGYPPVLVVVGSPKSAITRPNVFSIDEFVDLELGQLRDLFNSDDSEQ
ncbi:hypothetical protein [Sphingobium sp.]|uniref:hypothetical protein n=1 Tax=Sphingobium sp. TaxID=1912891 RepID=UPI002B53AA2F|nr:hypothetical protein [Sphingobium sp.]HUD92650.1 hypothetical protein [Sphingobium sp.]